MYIYKVYVYIKCTRVLFNLGQRKVQIMTVGNPEALELFCGPVVCSVMSVYVWGS
jgi:hypothetical protein